MPIGPEVRNRGSSSGQSHVPLFLGYLWKWFYKDQRHMTSYVTFRPRSTSVAGSVSNAEGFACCCRAVNDEDGYRVGAGQGFELTAVDVGHLGRSATWR